VFFSVQLNITTGEIGADVQATYALRLANLTGVNIDSVTLVISSGSTAINATIRVSNATAAEAVIAVINTAINESIANDIFLGFPVFSQPLPPISIAVTIPAPSPPPPALPPTPEPPPPVPAATSNGAVLSSAILTEGQGGWTLPLPPYANLGQGVTAAGDLDGDGSPDIIAGAPNENDFRGAIYVSLLQPDGSTKRVVQLGTSLPSPFDFFGHAIAPMVDLDNDGVIEIAVGAPGTDPQVAGAVYVIFLNANGTSKSTYIKVSNESSSGVGLPLDPYGDFGRSLAFLGDIDGDGSVELAVGAPGVNSVYILSLTHTTGPPSSTVLTRFRVFSQPASASVDETFGESLAFLPAHNGGVPRLAVGAPGAQGAPLEGAVYIFSLAENFPLLETLKSPQSVVQNRFGVSIALGPDWDGNGVKDLVVGASGDDGGGSIYISFQGTDVWSRIGTSQVSGLSSSAILGKSVALVGTLNDDLVPDLVAGVSTDVNGVDNVGALAILFMAPYLYDSPPPVAPPLPPEPPSPPTSPRPPTAPPPPKLPTVSPPVQPASPAVPAAAPISSAQTIEASGLHGVGLAFLTLLVLVVISGIYIFGVRKHSLRGIRDRAVSIYRYLASRPEALLEWSRKPILSIPVRNSLTIELHKPSAVKESIGGRRPCKDPPPGVPANLVAENEAIHRLQEGRL